MGEKENCASRVTRAATKKRAADVDTEALAASEARNRKRVVLGELRHLSNAAVPKPKPKPKPKKKPQQQKPEEVQPEKVVVVAASDGASVVDIDSGFHDPQICAHYASDIHQYLRSMEVEKKRRPSPDFIEAVQRDVTPNMRGILVDWLVEVAEEYKLVSDTLYLTVSYVDRFLSCHAIDRKKLQLLGVSSMLIASKYEEISPPHVEDFCYITDNTYTKEELLKMETDILKLLKFEMGNPTTKTFIRRYTREGQDDCNSPSSQLESLCNYLAELSLLDYGCVRFLPSIIAASAVFLARFIINPEEHPWNSSLRHYTGYNPSELKDCVNALHELQSNKKYPALTAIREKYKQNKFKCVAALSSPSDIPSPFFEDSHIQKV